MRTARSKVTLSVVVAFMVTLAFHSSLAAGTNTAVYGPVSMEFSNAPVSAIIGWLARLTDKPVIAPLNLTVGITYKTERKLTPDEAVRALTAVLASNKLYVVNIDNLYYRLATTTQTNKLADIPHTEIAVQEDRVLIEGRSVRWEDLPKAISVLVMPDAEIWVYDPHARDGLVSGPLTKLLKVLQGRKVYQAYLPPPPHK